jgi:hypothetical protein
MKFYDREKELETLERAYSGFDEAHEFGNFFFSSKKSFWRLFWG